MDYTQDKIFAVNLDKQTISQFKNCVLKDFVIDAALMPDAHSGYVAPIGSVLHTKDYIVPSWVGYDIGCGMIAIELKGENLKSKVDANLLEIYNEVVECVPMGKGKLGHIQDVSQKTKTKLKDLISKFKKGPYNKEVLRFLQNKSLSHLGTLGSGNHFIELGFNDTNKNDNVLWLIIHSGSRGVGHKVATHYMREASNSSLEYEQTYPLSIDSQEGKEYLNVLDFGLEFALLNRLEMAYKVISVIENQIKESIRSELWTNKNHNHAIYEEGVFIHRKGATPAKKKERGVIPANMKDGCFLVEGLGNKLFLESSSHGAGRKLSRSQAKTEINLEEFKKSMKGIIGNISQETIDEAPFAYKNIYDVMEAQKDSVKIIAHIKPMINWKG